MKKMRYEKPSIKEKKVKMSFFLGSRFLDSIDLIPQVFAQCTYLPSSCGCSACGDACYPPPEASSQCFLCN